MRGNQGWTVNSQGLSLRDGSINLPRIWSFQGKTFTLASFHRNFLLFVLPSSLSMVWAEFRIYTRLFSLKNYSVEKIIRTYFHWKQTCNEFPFQVCCTDFSSCFKDSFCTSLMQKCVVHISGVTKSATKFLTLLSKTPYLRSRSLGFQKKAGEYAKPNWRVLVIKVFVIKILQMNLHHLQPKARGCLTFCLMIVSL